MFGDTQLYLTAGVAPLAVSLSPSCLLRQQLTGRVNASWANMYKKKSPLLSNFKSLFAHFSFSLSPCIQALKMSHLYKKRKFREIKSLVIYQVYLQVLNRAESYTSIPYCYLATVEKTKTDNSSLAASVC